MHSPFSRHYTVIALLVILIAVLAFLCVLFFRDYSQLERATGMPTPAQIWRARTLTRAPLSLQDVGIVRSWMTFDYLNRVFRLPPGYLKDALHISDARYPHLSLET